MPARGDTYLEDGTRLYRVLERGPRGLLLLEDCAEPDKVPWALTAVQLREFGLRAVRRVPAISEKAGVV